MSVDLLQERIRKLKNPTILHLDGRMQDVPNCDCGNLYMAYDQYVKELLDGLKDIVPALRFGFSGFALLGTEGISLLSDLMHFAKKQGYYVLLDTPELYSNLAAENAVDALSDSSLFPCDGYIIPSYCGSDVIRPFLPMCKKGKAVFCVVRTANKSATEIQDLLTGGRLVHTAVADVVYRYGQGAIGKSGYLPVGAVASASSADSLRSLRTKYKGMFLLLDGYDYPNANAKNCSYAFDSLGHGAVACAGTSITAAWKEAENENYLHAAVDAAIRMRKNLTRYITVL